MYLHTYINTHIYIHIFYLFSLCYYIVILYIIIEISLNFILKLIYQYVINILGYYIFISSFNSLKYLDLLFNHGIKTMQVFKSSVDLGVYCNNTTSYSSCHKNENILIFNLPGRLVVDTTRIKAE